MNSFVADQGDVVAATSHLATALRNNPVHRFHQNAGCKLSQTHIGQVLDDFRIDVAALERMRAWHGRRGAGSGPQAPRAGYSGPYAGGDVAEGVFGVAGTGRRGSRRHSRADRAILGREHPPDVAALCDGGRDAPHGYRYFRFSKREARGFLDAFDPPGALAAFDRVLEPAMKADVFRLACLYHEGGCYIDADDR